MFYYYFYCLAENVKATLRFDAQIEIVRLVSMTLTELMSRTTEFPIYSNCDFTLRSHYNDAWANTQPLMFDSIITSKHMYAVHVCCFFPPLLLLLLHVIFSLFVCGFFCLSLENLSKKLNQFCYFDSLQLRREFLFF